MKHLKLMPDYDCWPIWNRDRPENIDPATLGLSQDLVQALAAWQASYDTTLLRHDPIASGFPSAETAAKFNAIGQDLVRRLREELPDVDIAYVEAGSVAG